MPAPETSEKTTASSFVDEFKSLVEKNIKGNMQLVSRVSDLIKAAGKSWEPGRPPSEGKQSALLTRLLDFNLASYEILSSHTLEMLNGLISAAESSLLGKDSLTQATAPPKTCGEINVQVRQGERLRARFCVENQFSDALNISFEAGELTAPDAASLPASLIAFEPANVTLDPREKVIVIAAIDISQAFVVGKTYTSTVRVLGFQGKEVRLVLTVLPPLETAVPAPKATATKARKGARKRKRGARAKKVA